MKLLKVAAAFSIIIVSAVSTFVILQTTPLGDSLEEFDNMQQTPEERELYKYSNEETIRPVVEEFMRTQATNATSDIEIPHLSLSQSEKGNLLTAEAYVKVGLGVYRYFDLEFTNEASPKLVSSKERSLCTFTKIRTADEAADYVKDNKGKKASDKVYLANFSSLSIGCVWNVPVEADDISGYFVYDNGKIEPLQVGTTTQ